MCLYLSVYLETKETGQEKEKEEQKRKEGEEKEINKYI